MTKKFILSNQFRLSIVKCMDFVIDRSQKRKERKIGKKSERERFLSLSIYKIYNGPLTM